MLDDNAYGLSRRRVTVSTSGVVPMIDRLGATTARSRSRCRCTRPNDALRDDAGAAEPQVPDRRAARGVPRYLERAPRDFITFEYCMLDGVNDSPAQAQALLQLLRGDGSAAAVCRASST